MKHLDSVSLDSFIFSSMTRAVQYSEKYNDDAYEYRLPDPPDLGFFLECTFKPRNVFMVLTNPSIIFRHVILPADIAKLCPKNRLLSEAEWRQIGVQQSRGWEHYALHKCVICISFSALMYPMLCVRYRF